MRKLSFLISLISKRNWVVSNISHEYINLISFPKNKFDRICPKIYQLIYGQIINFSHHQPHPESITSSQHKKSTPRGSIQHHHTKNIIENNKRQHVSLWWRSKTINSPRIIVAQCPKWHHQIIFNSCAMVIPWSNLLKK